MKNLMLRLGLLVVGVLVVYLVITHLYSPTTDPPAHSEEIIPDEAFVYDGEPVIQSITRWQTEDNSGLQAINQRLPDLYEVLVLGEDITANRAPNHLVIIRDPELPDLNSGLRDFGFSHVFRHLVVYETRNNTLYPVLTINPEAIRDEGGNTLIDQVPARNGYALLLEAFEHEELYSAPVELLEIVMLDENGREMSDEIVIYWDPAESAYKATNTFGAP